MLPEPVGVERPAILLLQTARRQSADICTALGLSAARLRQMVEEGSYVVVELGDQKLLYLIPTVLYGGDQPILQPQCQAVRIEEFQGESYTVRVLGENIFHLVIMILQATKYKYRCGPIPS